MYPGAPRRATFILPVQEKFGSRPLAGSIPSTRGRRHPADPLRSASGRLTRVHPALPAFADVPLLGHDRSPARIQNDPPQSGIDINTRFSDGLCIQLLRWASLAVELQVHDEL
ncbi:MAG: hypothetical protein KY467_04760 [Gemmatimonadetes bacterium]|nr:hypothetical protein [Gemmatimonadota bacterium]